MERPLYIISTTDTADVSAVSDTAIQYDTLYPMYHHPSGINAWRRGRFSRWGFRSLPSFLRFRPPSAS
eukprot:3622981-Prymnesium_polylepis.2